METKVPFYDVVNILLPGLVFIGTCIFLFLDYIKYFVEKITPIDSAGFEVLLTIVVLAIAYEVGYIIFRIGGVAVEPFFFQVFGYAEYEKFDEAKKCGANKLDTIAREFDYAKTRIVLYILLAVAGMIRVFCLGWNTKLWCLFAICFLCVVLFTLTARGHIKKIITTVNQYLTAPESEGKNG